MSCLKCKDSGKIAVGGNGRLIFWASCMCPKGQERQKKIKAAEEYAQRLNAKAD